MDFDPTPDHNENAFEGVLVVEDEGGNESWYAVWPSKLATDDYGMLWEIHPQQYWVTTVDNIPPGADGWAVETWGEEVPIP